MKITFVYTDTPGMQTSDGAAPRKSQFEVPDTIRQLPDAKEHVLAIARLVGDLTYVSLYVTCKELGIKEYPIKQVQPLPVNSFKSRSVLFRVLLIRFRVERYSLTRYLRRDLKILIPIDMPGLAEWNERRQKQQRSRSKSKKGGNFLLQTYWRDAEDHKVYVDTVLRLANACLALLNTEAPLVTGSKGWQFEGFHPFFANKPVVEKAHEQNKLDRAERRRQARQQEQHPLQGADLSAIPTPLTTLDARTGAGRRPGARPGIFRDVRFRSQLEIRFVTQLEAKGIHWVYESESLGASSYLVDFHLPGLKCWVEVKGRFEARDDFLLPEVATLLQQERQEKLFIYTQSKAFIVSEGGFQPMSYNEFWSMLAAQG